MSRIYRAPEGATSITVNDRTYEVDAKGFIKCDDESAHEALLSHGFTYGDAPAVAAKPDPAGDRARDLDQREAALNARTADLAKYNADLDERDKSLNARTADLANRETDLTLRAHALEQREAALAATTPPPPPAPPADTKPAKAK